MLAALKNTKSFLGMKCNCEKAGEGEGRGDQQIHRKEFIEKRNTQDKEIYSQMSQSLVP